MKNPFLSSVVLATFAAAVLTSAHAHAHKLLARAYNVGFGGDLSTDPNDPFVEKTFQDSDTDGNYVNNSASVDSQKLLLKYKVSANQSTGTKYTPSDWNVGAFLEQQMRKAKTGGATGVVVQLPLVVSGSSVPNGAANPTIVDVTGAIAVGNCRASAQIRITPAGIAAAQFNDGCSGNPRGSAKLLTSTIVIEMTSLLDEQTLEASLSFQTSFGGFGSAISADAMGELAIKAIGGSLEFDSPTFGQNATASINPTPGTGSSSGGTSSGGTASSSSGGSSSGGSSSGAPATPPPAQSSSDDSSCTIGRAGGDASSFAPLGLAGMLAAVLRRRRRAWPRG